MMQRCIGLMSGTSMDAVDAALCTIDDGRFTGVEAVASERYPAALRARLLELQSSPGTTVNLRELAGLDHSVALAFAAAAQRVIDDAHVSAADVAVIGAHGQTVFHDPTGARSSLQLGDPNLIAAHTGITVAADFRRADIARGGQGAPLVPAFHQHCFGASAPCAILNIGGIANLTLLRAGGDIGGFDTGPGNALMDAWIERHRGQAFDRDGAWAAGGRVDASLLRACLADPYFGRAPPKSTGRDQFNLDWLERSAPRIAALAPEDVQRTLCALTAESVARALQSQAADLRRVFVCGGGARNSLLMQALRDALPDHAIDTTAGLGLNVEVVEAAAFAWLGWCRLQARPGNLPSVTGARAPAVLGGLYLA
jgi:anhydro-N-acetylmuramic acid kinase